MRAMKSWGWAKGEGLVPRETLSDLCPEDFYFTSTDFGYPDSGVMVNSAP